MHHVLICSNTLLFNSITKKNGLYISPPTFTLGTTDQFQSLAERTHIKIIMSKIYLCMHINGIDLSPFTNAYNWSENKLLYTVQEYYKPAD